jgi:phage terminase large subunit-like protein
MSESRWLRGRTKGGGDGIGTHTGWHIEQSSEAYKEGETTTGISSGLKVLLRKPNQSITVKHKESENAPRVKPE